MYFILFVQLQTISRVFIDSKSITPTVQANIIQLFVMYKYERNLGICANWFRNFYCTSLVLYDPKWFFHIIVKIQLEFSFFFSLIGSFQWVYEEDDGVVSCLCLGNFMQIVECFFFVESWDQLKRTEIFVSDLTDLHNIQLDAIRTSQFTQLVSKYVCKRRILSSSY